MRLSISPRNHEHINRKISSGRYGSADDVLDAALALLDEREAALDHELRDVRRMPARWSLPRRCSQSYGSATPTWSSKVREPLQLYARGSCRLQQIHDYIAKDNPAAALRFVDRIEAHCTRLAHHST